MADVAGFRAVGFVANKVPLDRAVAPADVESAAERARCLALDPHNAIRLVDPAASMEAAFAGLADPVAQWLDSGVLRQDGGRALYRYHQEYALADLGGRVLLRRGLLCAVRLPSLADNGIKPHQAVREDEVQAHAQLMKKLGLHAAPVMAAYRDPAVEVDRLFRKLESSPPTFQVQTPDGTWHRIWRCGDAEIIGAVRHFFSPRRLYILDGHERLAAMQATGAKLAEETSMPMYAAGNYVTMCLINLEDQALLPAPVHRLLGGPAIAQAEVLSRAARYFSVTKLEGLAQAPAKLARVIDEWTSTQACFALAFPGSADLWQLTLLPAVNPRDEGVVGHPAVTRLDPWVIQELFLRRVLGKPEAAAAAFPPAAAAAPMVSVSVEGAAAVAPVAATLAAAAVAPAAAPSLDEWPMVIVHDISSALAALQARSAWLAVLARPLPMTQVVHTADLGQELPPRSTHFAPQMLGGLAMLRLTADEDLI
jgi:uncharacterized protein (DUF1015 family)